MKPKTKHDLIAEQVNAARNHVLEHALLGFVEALIGRCPTNTEIEECGRHIQFSPTPLSVFEKNGHRWSQFYSWNQEILAIGFLDSNNLLSLDVCRLRREDWPPALAAWIHQNRPPPNPA